MMQTLKNLGRSTLITGLLATSAFAAAPEGGMTSGGGELLGDSENPWFANYEGTATYCVEADEDTFGLPTERLRALVEGGINYWREEISRGRLSTHNGFLLNVVPQTFALQERCTLETDIRFKFGRLNEEERRALPDPSKYVAVALRTSYDEVQLHGKGFVYVSPEAGPLRLNDEDLIDKPWSSDNGGLLHYIILHELGHVFGIRHHGGRYNLMAAEFPESVLQKHSVGSKGLDFLLGQKPQIFSFRQAVSGLNCTHAAESKVHVLFGLPQEFPCITTKVDRQNIYFYVSDGKRNMHLVKTISLQEDENPRLRTDDLIELRLTDRQAIFPGYPKFASFIQGPSVIFEKKQGTFRNDLSGLTGVVSVQMSPTGFFSLDVYQSGSLYMDLISGGIAKLQSN